MVNMFHIFLQFYLDLTNLFFEFSQVIELNLNSKAITSYEIFVGPKFLNIWNIWVRLECNFLSNISFQINLPLLATMILALDIAIV